MRRASLLVLPLLSFVLWGCAFNDYRMQLPKHVVSGRKFEGKGRTIVVVGPFADKRATPDRIGMKKDGYGIETASVLCAGTPSAWIADRLAEDLASSGFTVLTGEAAALASTGTLRVEGEILKLFGEPVVGFFATNVETDFHVRLVATLPSGRRAERNVFVKGRSPDSVNIQCIMLLAGGLLPAVVSGAVVGAPLSDEDHDIALKDASRQLVGEMAKSIVALVEREAPPGVSSGTPVATGAGTERRLP